MIDSNQKTHAHKQIVYLYKVDFPDDPPVKIQLPSNFKDLCEIAETKLDLRRPVKQILNKNHEPYTDIESIPSKACLYVSCATPYNEDAPIYKSRLPRKNYEINLPQVKHHKIEPQSYVAQSHQALAKSSNTVQENMRESLLSLFSSMTPEQKAALSSSPQLAKLASDTGYFSLEHELLSQSIGPTSVIYNSDIYEKMNVALMNHLKGFKQQDCQFVIVGPEKSGKSTALLSIVMLFYQKLQISSELENYLIFPMNWSLYSIYLDDLAKLYGIFISITIDSLRYSRMDLIPFIAPLKQWFLSLITIPTFPLLPPSILHNPSLHSDSLSNAGSRIHKAWNSKSGFEDFLIQTLQFPLTFAHALGMKSCVYVFDHFDDCGYILDPNENFPESKESLSIIEILCRVISNASYFIASLDDSEFFDNFTLQNYQQISTERLITLDSEKEILIAQPPLSISIDCCRGCPAYCANFRHLCEAIENLNKNSKVKNQFSNMKSIIDSSRKRMLRHEIFKFCMLVASGDKDVFSPDVMNNLEKRMEYEITLR